MLIFVILMSNIVFLFTSLYEMQMLQQNSYNENHKFFHYYNKDATSKNINTYLLRFLYALLLLMYTEFDKFLTILYIVIMLALAIQCFIIYKKHNKKLPLKFTSRMQRIMFLDYLFLVILEILVLKNCALPIYAGATLLYTAINGYILMFVVILLTPVERLVFNHYKKEALTKLAKMNNLKIIGITGSFGKTSTKMILDSILKTTFKGFYTPASFNTPNGLLLTINREKTIFNDYFISEMGAKKKGEIKELCDLVHPKYGILTSIGAAHLETFKSLDNICQTKFELIESLGKDGVGILNKDDEYQRKYKLKNKCKVIWVGIERKADVMAKDIKISSKGTSFTIAFKDGSKSLKVNTILLGNKNVYNILSAVALARHLGVPDKNIIKGIKEIAPIEHRLEIREYKNITIIDDSFNSNPQGAKNAVEVLGLMEGKKLIITPGMIEMGEKQEALNFEFGAQIAEVADEVYLVGPKQTKPIYNGLISKKYDESKIKVFNSFTDAYNCVISHSGNKKCTLLIENDLPDSYTEE